MSAPRATIVGMGSALIYVAVVGLVAGVIYLLAAVVFGRGEELAPMPPGATPTRLPAEDLAGADVRGLHFQLALRGYKMSEVDWALDRLAAEVDTLRGRLAALEGGARHAAGHPGTGPGPVPPGSVPPESAPPGTAPTVGYGAPYRGQEGTR